MQEKDMKRDENINKVIVSGNMPDVATITATWTKAGHIRGPIFAK